MPSKRKNPLLAADLALIISTFEESMVESLDEASVFAKFRGDILGLEEVPRSVIRASDAVPAVRAAESSGDASEGQDSAKVRKTTSIPDRSAFFEDEDDKAAARAGSSEDADIEEGIPQKIQNWIEECIPCDGRSWSKLNPDLMSDMGDSWEEILKGIDAKLNDLENLLNSNDIFDEICEVISGLKYHCVPDLKKIIWLLMFLLSRMTTEVKNDLNFFDSLITSILSPIFNELISNLNLLSNLALEPIKCVFDQLILVTQGVGSTATAAGSAISSIREPGIMNRNNARDEAAARRARERRRDREGAAAALGGVASGAANLAREMRDVRREVGIGRLTRYIEQGMDAFKSYQRRLLTLLQESINQGLDLWNDNLSFGMAKMDILRLIAIIKATVETAMDGKIDCGPDSDDITKEELASVIAATSEGLAAGDQALDISVENDTVIIRRNPVGRAAMRTEVEESEMAGDTVLPNVVFEKPISSCLKKLTDDQASKAALFIKQLEEDLDY